MTHENFSVWLINTSNTAKCAAHRLTVVLNGSFSWADNLLNTISSYESKPSNTLSEEWLVYNDQSNGFSNVNKHTFKNKLGREYQYVLFNSCSLNIDALAALSGTLVPGGVLFIHIANQQEFLESSAFNQRFFEKIKTNNHLHYLSEDSLQMLNHDPVDDAVVRQLSGSLPFQCGTQEQVNAVEHVIQVVKGHRNRPLVLTADRGRGKSSALAIACAQLIKTTTSFLTIVITSAHRKSLDIFFDQLVISFGGDSLVEVTRNAVNHKNGLVKFVAMDDLLINKPEAGLLLVDEAASVPLYQLNTLIHRYHRIVFSSTVHGYEGAGRSFSIKFLKSLKNIYPSTKILHIQEPIRWAKNDPLEHFIFDLCLLNAELPSLSLNVTEDNSNELEYECVTAQQLLKNEALLSQIFAVLVTAHYQTSPSDLRLLLDNEHLTIVVMKKFEHLVGVALLVREGQVNIGDVEQIKNNERRLKNQFIPQSLLAHCGEQQSFNYSYYRIMRIAVLPELQNKGLGKQFLNYIEILAKQNQIDFVGTSFGANNQLLNFWLQNDYKLARLGFTKDKASGEHSALLLKAMNQKGGETLSHLETNFYVNFEFLLAEQFSQLSPALVWLILHYRPQHSISLLNDYDSVALTDFYSEKRQYNHCALSLFKWLHHQMKLDFQSEIEPVIAKVLQRKSVEEICSQYKFSGKKAFNQFLITYVKRLEE